MSNYFVALDIGASKIVCLKGRKSANKIIIDSAVIHPSEGIRRGEITNDKVFIEDLSSAIYESEKKFSMEISEIFVNISNASIRYKQLKVFKKFQGRQVTEKDLAEILQKVRKKFEEEGSRVIKIGFIYHYVEGMGRVDEPEYMFVNGLTSTINIVYVPQSYVETLEDLIFKSHTKVQNFILSSEASAIACLSKEDLLQDTVVLDIGASNIDYILYEGGVASGYGVIPLGGNDITRDISTYFNIPLHVAEEIKRKYGGFVADQKEQYIKTQSKSGTHKVIDKKLLKEIIAARLEEMFKLVIKNIGLQKQGFIFILTGGGSNIPGIEMFLSKKYGIVSRVVNPSESGEFIQNDRKVEILNDPSLSTACGIMKFAIEQKRQISDLPPKNVFLKLLKWIRENF